jgi:hypothetical protein
MSQVINHQKKGHGGLDGSLTLKKRADDGGTDSSNIIEPHLYSDSPAGSAGLVLHLPAAVTPNLCRSCAHQWNCPPKAVKLFHRHHECFDYYPVED